MRFWMAIVLAPAVMLASAGSARAASTLYVSSDADVGDNQICSEHIPCSLFDANAVALDGDTIQLAGGDYAMPGSSLIDKAVTVLGGQGTDRPILHVNGLKLSAPGATLSDVSIVGTGSATGNVLEADGTTIERVDAFSQLGSNPRVICELAGPASVVRDSVCATRDSGANAVEVTGGGDFTFRHLTAAGGTGIQFFPFGDPLTATIRNSILIGSSGDLNVGGDGSGVTIDHSRAATISAGVQIGAGNISSPVESIFNDLGAGDLNERPGSATIDAGTADGAVPGEVDLAGSPRSLAGAPDMGALEWVPTIPLVITGSVTGISATAVFVPGVVNPQGAATAFHVDYGPTPAYGAATADAPAGAGTVPVDVQATVAGLAPLTTYHYRVVAGNAYGPTYGADQTFTTAALPAATPTPTPTATPAPKPAKVTITLPSTKKCRPTRSYSVRAKIAAGGKITSVEVWVNKKRKLRVTGSKALKAIKVSKLPAGGYTLEVRVKTKDGRTVKSSHKYRSCAHAKA
jgi:hypothetical protein